MGRIPGYYEWDDDDLTPARKKEGGFHQNLFDADGKLRGHARFIPSDKVEPDPVYLAEYVTEHVYVPAEERRLTPEQQELADLISEVLLVFLAKGIDRAKPHVKRWWTESGRPFVSERRTRLVERLPKRAPKASRAVANPHGGATSDQSPADNAMAVLRPKMSSAEAQARYLAAMAARAFSEEQMKMVRRADIIDAEDVVEIERKIAELPPHEVRELMSKMVTDPTMLSEAALAELASALARANRADQHWANQLPCDDD
ncbi:hypothetical protein GII30_03090 [Gordonia amarae]|uniref:Uncharacterized protein n=2 Tax=Gordonia amarae TaxID=36821 RepID=G7GUN5_9ACTN|nr:hypothetical protein [Gordonia amarae]MCS3877345.1 ubiquinone biosynthesis protein UbiJ [Gordonia amarae]QHN16101.1 hypothetical protein GII35_03095 [Gordonia amarae]QHN20669.1 hypothetical protein GII34_03095 [Gordonia amarae]QHN29521.1 hypothetical protein GII32_03100 [Gordonia amarae]QHN38297.1 hypothetical protein GII30_03090 [Gordonia amarae]